MLAFQGAFNIVPYTSIMELIQLLSSFSSTTYFFLILIFLMSLTKLSKRSKATKLPPGPWQLPIIGSLQHLATRSLPHHTFYKLSKTYGPLMHMKLGQIPAYIVSSPLMAKYAIKTNDRAFDNESSLASIIISYNRSGIVFTPYSDHWKQVRRICVTELLSNKKVRSLKSIREQEVSDLIAMIERSVGSPMNLSAKLSSLTSSIISRALLGEKHNDENTILELMIEANTLISTFKFTDFFPSLKILGVISGTMSKIHNIHNEIDKVLDEIIVKHRNQCHNRGKEEQDHEDMVDVLLRIQQRNEQELPITDNIIKALIMELYGAATDTSFSTIEWAMAEMIKNPRVMKKAQSELRNNGFGYLEMVIKETLRLHPPIPLLPKLCKESCEINGYQIPEKSRVVFNFYAIGRDPECWSDAESFIPERFVSQKVEFNNNNYELIPFGAGRRLCPGMSFGLAMIELALAKLLYHFDWKLPSGLRQEDIDMSETFGLISGKKEPLYLIATLNDTKYVN